MIQMNTIKSIIIDDERLARVTLRKLLEIHSEIEIVAEADSCLSGVEVINLYVPDLIFLDIQLGGESGFDLLEKVENNFKVIFVTAFDEYALRAFDVNATDYLLKPVNPERLKRTLQRIINNNESPTTLKKFEYSDSIYVKLNNFTSTFVKISSIIHIESVGNYSKIVCTEKKSFLILKTLKQWEDELPVNNFKRIHRSNIINIEFINKIEKYSNSFNKVYLSQVEVPLEVSRRFASKLKK